MFSGSCFKWDCKAKLFGKCQCQESMFFCFNHMIEHLQSPSLTGHILANSYFKPREEIKGPVIKRLNEMIGDINEFKKNVIKDASETIRNFNASFQKYIEKVIKAEKNCKQLIDTLIRGEEVLDIAEIHNMESVLKLDANQANHKMSLWNVNNCITSLSEINELVTKTFEKDFNPYRVIIEDYVESNELSFFKHGTTNFTTVNLDSLGVSTGTVGSTEAIYYNASSLLLVDKSYFYYGNGTNSGYTFIIDKIKNIKQLARAKVNYNAGVSRVGNYIYAFGGSSGLSERYDMVKDKWESLAPLPLGVNYNYCCTTNFDSLILISGLHLEKIITYDVYWNKYSDVPNLTLQNGYYKSFLRGNDRIYLIEIRARLFESVANDISEWVNIGNNSLQQFFQSAFVQYKGSIWFVECESVLWRFDLDSKQAIKVKTL